MSKEVRVLAWCDGCAGEIDESDGNVEPAVVEVTVALGIDKPLGKPRTLDLCDRHRKQLVDALATALDEFGASAGVGAPVPRVAPVRRATRKGRFAGERPWLCLWCPLDYAAESGLRSHVHGVHGFASTSAAYGGTCPLCGDVVKSGRLGTHTGKAHPDSGNVTQVFRAAREAGDPVGVVAKRLRAGKRVANR